MDSMSNNSSQERHEKGFTGVFIPWWMFEFFENQTLNPKEVMLLAEILSLSHKQLGCVASNAYLGKLFNVTENRITAMITKMKKLKVLKQVGFNGRKRILKVISEPLVGGANAPMVGRGEHKGRPCENTRAEPMKTQGLPPSKHKGHSIESSLESSLERKGGDGEADANSNGSSTSIKATNSRKKKKTQTEHQMKFDRRAAIELLKVFKKNKMHPLQHSKLSSIGMQIVRLREEGASKEQIVKVIKWMQKHYDPNEEFTPNIWRLSHIHEKFGAIECKMRKDQQIAKKTANMCDGVKVTRDNMWQLPSNSPSGWPKIWVGLDGRYYDGDFITEVHSRWKAKKEHQTRGKSPMQNEVDVVLEKMGRKKGELNAKELWCLCRNH